MERWEKLFAQLESEFVFEDLMELHTTAAELSRAEMARVQLTERLAAAVGREVEVALGGGRSISGDVVNVNPEWLLLTISGKAVIVPTAGIVAVFGLPVTARVSAGRSDDHSPDRASHPALRTGEEEALAVSLNSVLRSIARDRAVVRVSTNNHSFAGRVQRVSADHFDLLSGGAGEWEERRSAQLVTVATAHAEYIMLT